MIMGYFYGLFLTPKIMHDTTVDSPHHPRASSTTLVKDTMTEFYGSCLLNYARLSV